MRGLSQLLKKNNKMPKSNKTRENQKMFSKKGNLGSGHVNLSHKLSIRSPHSDIKIQSSFNSDEVLSPLDTESKK